MHARDCTCYISLDSVERIIDLTCYIFLGVSEQSEFGISAGCICAARNGYKGKRKLRVPYYFVISCYKRTLEFEIILEY